MRHKISMLNMILEPLSNALGSKYNKGKVNKKKSGKKVSPEEKEKLLLHKFKSFGFLS